jgi:putative oxidoreductase
MKNLSTLAPLGARLLLGLIFAVFGLNGFLQFIPIPPAEGAAATFMGGLFAAGYFFPMLASVQILVGVALLTNILTPIALIVLAPITVNIVAYHTLAPEGMPLALLVLVLHLGVAWSLRARFTHLFQTPSAS